MAFQIRQAGYRVYYQPLAQVTHFEGVTSGTDLSTSVKSYQLINQQKVREKWSEVLKHHGESGADPYATKERQVAKRILFLDACVLTPDQDAGSVMVFNHLKTFQSLGYKVTFAPDNLQRAEGYTANMQRLGIECLYWPQTKSIKSHLEEHGEDYDLVFMTRADVAAKHGDDVRAHCSRARIIFNTIDLHFVREQRWAELERNTELAEKALKRKDLELSIAAKSDCTLVVSSYEKEILLRENSRLNVSVVPLTVEMPGRQTDFHERDDLMYIGGFQHTPNVDAVLYFVQSIYPLIKLTLPDIKFYILGSKPPDEILDLATDSSIVVTGYLEDVAPYFNRCRLSVAPLRYGAGLKGKVITSLSHGLPMVASTIACEGTGLEDEINILIADDPAEFAEKVIRLYTDATLWNRLSTAGFEKVNRDYSAAATKSYFEHLFMSLGQPTEKNVPVLKLVKQNFAAGPRQSANG
jgi:glycosyltransferase involved in cell wall biosynthesis